MRHRKLGRKFGRSSSHRLAMFRNLASSLFLTERDAEYDDNKPKIKGRIVTTLPKAKEARGLVERCITIARHALVHQAAANKLASGAERGSDEWKRWRKSKQWQEWAQAISPVVAARRRCLRLLGDKQAVRILFDDIAPRFADREGGYTRVLKLPNPRLGDAGARAVLEFVGVRDRVVARSQKPAFDAGESPDKASEETSESAN
jgi:large subunit ribosomal protein L17